jgi:hypothetical protein
MARLTEFHRQHCRVFVPVPAASGRGPVAARQLGGTRVARCSPRGATPAQGRLVQAVGRKALGPSLAFNEEGPAPSRAGT